MKLTNILQVAFLLAVAICFYFTHAKVKWVGLAFLVAALVLHFWTWIKAEAVAVEQKAGNVLHRRSTDQK